MIARTLAVLAAVAAVGLLGQPTLAEAGDPLVFFGGRLRLGGEVSGTIAPPTGGS